MVDDKLMDGISRADAAVIEELGNVLREECNRAVYAVALAPLSELLRPDVHATVSAQAARALANLCFENAANRIALARRTEALAFLCQPHVDVALQRSVTGCLANLLSEDDEAGEGAVAVGAVEALVRALPAQMALACRGLSNAAQKGTWSERAAAAGALAALLACEQGEEVLEVLVSHESVARQLAADKGAVVRLASELKWEKPLVALCSIDSTAAVLAESEEVWRALDKFPRCQGLVSGAEAGSTKALRERERLLSLVQQSAAVEGEPEAAAKSKAEVRSGALLALGNAARSDEAVGRILALEGLIPIVLEQLKGTTSDQHLATGLLGNLAVPADVRAQMADAGVVRAVALCLSLSFNAHVMMNSAVLLRRLSLDQHARRLVAAELPLLLAQRERLSQPEHSRVTLELGRVAALCLVEDVQATPEVEKALLDLLHADWSVLRVEAARGCAVLADKCSPALIERLLTLLQDSSSDGTTRVAAAIALARAAPANASLHAALAALEKDETVVDGEPLSVVSKKILASIGGTHQ